MKINKTRLILFFALLLLLAIHTALFPAHEAQHYNMYVFEYGWPSVFLTIRDLRHFERRGFPIHFSFDALALAINIIFVWLVACGIYKIYMKIKTAKQNQRQGDDRLCKNAQNPPRYGKISDKQTRKKSNPAHPAGGTKCPTTNKEQTERR